MRMNVAQKTQFEKLFKEKKFYEIPNSIYRGWLGFKIAALGSEENLFNNILAAKTITEIPRTKKRRFDGPTGAAKKRYQHREPCSFKEQRRRKGSIVERNRREEEREAKEKRKGKVS